MIISLFDYTGEAVKPWAEAGHFCACLDIQHKVPHYDEHGILYRPADLSNFFDAIEAVRLAVMELQDIEPSKHDPIDLIVGFPPCTDLAVSGAKHWEKKRKADPEFQDKAVAMCQLVRDVANYYGAPWCIENPVGALSTLWRKPDIYINPCDFGGYIPDSESEHPTWPDHIPPRDAYTKKTGLWYGNGFIMPEFFPVEPVYETSAGKRSSKQWAKLGGKSLKTKNIRSATPRGLARAIYQANGSLRAMLDKQG